MGKPYPLAFRKRVVGAVESGGLSCNQAAKQFGIGVSTAIGWVNRLRSTGDLAPGQMGGHKPKAISGEHRVWLLQRTKNGDFTLRGLVVRNSTAHATVSVRSSTAACAMATPVLFKINACAQG
jgi:transposase